MPPRALIGFLLLAACAEATSPPNDGGAPAVIQVAAGDTQSAAVANLLRVEPTVVVLNAARKPLAGAGVRFTVTGGGGWTVGETVTTDAVGRASVAWYLGPRPGNGHRLQATVTGSSAPSVTFSANALPLKADSTYFGRNRYIEFHAGSLPLLLSAPHGGTLLPAEIPDRTSGETVRDLNTAELALATSDAALQLVGRRPYVVLNRLHRLKLDANREITEAAAGNPYAERAWREWHGFLSAAAAAIESSGGPGFYIDLHGHGHAIQRLELGYLLSASELALSDAQLNTTALASRSSIRSLAQRSPLGLAALLHGPQSLGALLEDRGFPAVPSQAQPSPLADPYFTGGYNTARYGSSQGGAIDGVQIEANAAGVRDNAANREAFGRTLVEALRGYFAAHYGRELE